MILPIMDTASGRITIFERDPRPAATYRSRVRAVAAEELAKRSLCVHGFACENEEELAHMAMCGMFPGPYGPEDYGQ